MAKMSITFDGFKNLAYDIDKAGGNLHKAVDEALTETQNLVQTNVGTASLPYAHKGKKGYATGAMYEAIIEAGKVEWHGTVAQVRGGFDLHTSGGFHSIFIMYGTPRIAKDQKVYNAIKGSKTKKEIAKIQQEILQKYLSLAKGE